MKYCFIIRTISKVLFNRCRCDCPVEGFLRILKDNALGEVYIVHLNNSELYYLRLLMHKVSDLISLKFLKTVDDVTYPMFLATYKAHHLLDCNQHLDKSPCRMTYFSLSCWCSVDFQLELWKKCYHHLAEDFLRLYDIIQKMIFRKPTYPLKIATSLPSKTLSSPLVVIHKVSSRPHLTTTG